MQFKGNTNTIRKQHKFDIDRSSSSTSVRLTLASWSLDADKILSSLLTTFHNPQVRLKTLWYQTDKSKMWKSYNINRLEADMDALSDKTR